MRTWLIDRRKELTLSHNEIASKCDITRQYYSMIESGDRNPSVKVAKKIALVLGLDWTKFFETNKKRDTHRCNR